MRSLLKLLTGTFAAAFRRRAPEMESRGDAIARAEGIMIDLDITDKELDGVRESVRAAGFDRSMSRARRIVAGWPEWKREAVMGSLAPRRRGAP